MRTMTEDVRRYLAAVETELADLGTDERSELLGDVEEHLTDVAAEHEGSLEERLGDPAAYASELRSSAGFPTAASTVERRDWAATARTVLSDSRVRTIRATLSDIQPGWWILRGYLFVVTIGVLGFGAQLSDIPIPRIDANRVFGLVVVALAVAASFALGRVGRRSRLAAIPSVAVSVLVVVMTLAALSEAKVRIGARSVAPTPVTAGIRHADGTEVTNLCPYSADGRPLSGVLLYDSAGRPVTEVSGAVTAPGTVTNAYPRDVDAASQDTARAVTCPKLTAVTVTTTGGPSWIEAMVGGSNVYAALLKPGQTRTFYGENVALVVGNSGAVVLRVNGKVLGKPGAMGQVYRASFDASTTALPPAEPVG